MYGTDEKEVLSDRWHQIDFMRVADADIRELLLMLREEFLSLLTPEGIKDEDIGHFIGRVHKIVFEISFLNSAGLTDEELDPFLNELDEIIFASYLCMLPEDIRPHVKRADCDFGMAKRGVG